MRISVPLAAAALCAAACSQLPAQHSSWNKFVDEFIEADFAANPTAGVRAGRHEFDGRLPELSPESFKRNVARVHSFRDRASAFALDDRRERFERDYLVAHIDDSLFWLETMESPYRQPFVYAGAMTPDLYTERAYAPLETRMRAYVRYLREIPRAALAARENLRTPMPRTYARLGAAIFGGMASFYEKDAVRIFAPVADARLQEEFAAANADAIRAVKMLSAWFRSQEAAGDDSYVLGPERFRQMLRRTEGIDIPLAKLKEMGERDLERNFAALRDECGRYAPGDTLNACVEKVQSHKPAQGPVEAATEQLGELRAFVISHKVVSVPSNELCEVREAPPHRRWNAAYMSAPGPYESNLPSYFFIAPPDPAWTEKERLAYIPDTDDLLFYSIHEVWPGHFLQHLHEKRSKSKIGQLYGSYAFSEGWAHYAEEMMWEVGVSADPAVHISQITNALLRDVRYLSAIGLHTEGMTVAQSEAMFREKAFQDPGNARQQAARGTFDPGYGAYTLGKLMIRELRDDWTRTRGGRAAWQAFHDELLSYGAPPIPLVRKAMMQDR